MDKRSGYVSVKIIFALLLAAVCLSACTSDGSPVRPVSDFINSFRSPTQESLPPEDETQPTAAVSGTPQINETPEASILTETPEPTQTNYTIRLWVPPQFDPEQDIPGGKALAAAIASYTELHPNISVTTRIKAVSGDSSVINTLTAANHVAKDMMPSLALLSRSNMEIAVQRGLVQPIQTSVFSDSNSWYGYARQAAVIDNTIYGIPLLGDCQVLAYRPSKTGAELTDWKDILTRGLPIGFAPSSSTSLFGTFIYLNQGSKLTNEQGQTYLDQQKLTETLNFFLSGGQNGAFPPSLAQFVDESQVWQRFNEGTMSIIVSQFSTFRHYQSPDISVHALPLSEGYTDYPLVSAWNLVMTEDNLALQEETIKFAEFLADISINDNFSKEAGYLPVRKSNHEAWQEDPQMELITAISESGVLIPNNQITNKIVPVINTAVAQVIKNQLSPELAAQDAIAALN